MADGSTRNWSFNLLHYKELIKALQPLKNVSVAGLPEFLIRAMQENIEIPNDSCLDQIRSKELVASLLDFQKT